jgi:hypothetical protein
MISQSPQSSRLYFYSIVIFGWNRITGDQFRAISIIVIISKLSQSKLSPKVQLGPVPEQVNFESSQPQPVRLMQDSLVSVVV